MNERVDIVMATYNGMPYIREQLQSILWQYCEIEVWDVYWKI